MQTKVEHSFQILANEDGMVIYYNKKLEEWIQIQLSVKGFMLVLLSQGSSLTRLHIFFSLKKYSQDHMNVCSRHQKQTTFTGQDIITR